MRNCNCCNHNNCCRNTMYDDMYSSNHSSCGCQSNRNPFPTNYLYGHAYTPNQTLGETFTPQVGLENGSMFPELVSPYYPGQSMDFIEYLKTTNRNGGCGCE